MESERKVLPGCVNAGDPFHECGDYCARGSHSHNLKIDRGKSPVVNGEGVRAEGRIRDVDPNCANASNPFHQCRDYCVKKPADAKKQSGSGRFALPVLKFSPRSLSDRSDGSKSVQSGEIVRVEGRNVDPNCVNASNPFHQCADYCSKKISGKTVDTTVAVQNGALSKENVRKMGEGRKVDPMCVNASNPFHQCTEYCSQRTPGAKRQTNGHTLGALIARETGEEVATRENRKEVVVIRENRKVDPRCPNASNPFHECAEYCRQKISGSGREEEGKPDRSKAAVIADRSKGSTNIVSERKDVDPRCVNASNPFHKCAEYCSQRIHEAT